MFGWFKRKSKPLRPESKWVVTCQGDHISVIDENGDVKSVAKADLSGVVIETNDSGPWGADLWWLLFGADDQLACAFPQGATEEQVMIDYLSALPDFDHGKMIEAMTSTDNATFALWRKPM